MEFKPSKDVQILVIDDDKEVADTLVSQLNHLGLNGTAAYGGLEGLDRFKTDNFKFVLLDLKMPDMDGMEVLKAIKAIDSQAVVLMITGYGTVEAAVAAIKAGAYDFISKPVNMDELEAIINRVLERQTLLSRLSTFRGLALCFVVLVPLWLILGIILAKILLK